MVVALLQESNLELSDDVVQTIVDKVPIGLALLNLLILAYVIETFWCFFFFLMVSSQTFSDADSKGDGKIDPEEWKEFVLKNPSIIKNMTLPFLKWVASSKISL